MRPDNPDAQDLALRCDAAVNDNPSDAENLAKYKVIYEPCEGALRLDPHNVLALKLVSGRLLRSAFIGQSADMAGDIKRANELLAQLVAIDPNGASAPLTKSLMLYGQGRMDEAVVENERSIVLNPSNMDAYFGVCASANGAEQPQKALEYADKAIRLSPRDPYLYRFYLQKGWALYGLKRDAEALDWLDRSLSLAPNYPSPMLILVPVLENLGRDSEAHEIYQRYGALPGRHLGTIAQLKSFFALLSPANDPASVAAHERTYEAFRKVGMPEE